MLHLSSLNCLKTVPSQHKPWSNTWRAEAALGCCIRLTSRLLIRIDDCSGVQLKVGDSMLVMMWLENNDRFYNEGITIRKCFLNWIPALIKLRIHALHSTKIFCNVIYWTYPHSRAYKAFFNFYILKCLRVLTLRVSNCC